MHEARPAGALAFVLSGPTLALGQDRTWEWQSGMHPMAFMWGAGGIVMMVMMLVFWGVVIADLVLGVRWLARQGGGAKRLGAGSPAATLRARLDLQGGV